MAVGDRGRQLSRTELEAGAEWEVGMTMERRKKLNPQQIEKNKLLYNNHWKFIKVNNTSRHAH